MAQLLDPRLVQGRIRSHLHLFAQCMYSRMGTSEGYIEKVMGVDPDDEPFLFETLDEAKLASIISTQKKVIAHQKTKAQ